MLGCKPNPVNLVGGVVVMVGGAIPLMWVVVVTATVGGITEFEGIAKSGPFAAVAETTNNNTNSNTTAGDTITNNTTAMNMTKLNANTEQLIALTEKTANHLNTLVTIGAMTEKNTKSTNNNLANLSGSLV